MQTIINVQDWENKLQLPVMGDTILSTSIKNALNGALPALLDEDQREDYPVYSLMSAYEKKYWNSAELGGLYLLSLFPYPVPKPVILSALTELSPLNDKNQLKWNNSGGFYKILSRLSEAGQPDVNRLEQVLNKLSADGLAYTDDNIVCLFRPVAAYFADSLKNHFFDEWRIYQQQLLEHYGVLAANTNDSEEQFWFNCKKLLHGVAGSHKQQVMNEIYRPQLAPLLNQSQHADTKGRSLQLHLLTGFFQQPWSKTDFCLKSETKGYVQAEAGRALYHLGDEEIALELLANARQVLSKEKNWQAACETSYLLGQHAFEQQDQFRGVELFQQSINYAEQGEDRHLLLKRLRSLFEIHKQNGDIQEASVIADKAKTLLGELRQQKAA